MSSTCIIRCHGEILLWYFYLSNLFNQFPVYFLCLLSSSEYCKPFISETDLAWLLELQERSQWTFNDSQRLPSWLFIDILHLDQLPIKARESVILAISSDWFVNWSWFTKWVLGSGIYYFHLEWTFTHTGGSLKKIYFDMFHQWTSQHYQKKNFMEWKCTLWRWKFDLCGNTWFLF